MRYWVAGKVTGTAVGWLVGGPVGGLLGLALGHALDTITEPDEPPVSAADRVAEFLAEADPEAPPKAPERPGRTRAAAPAEDVNAQKRLSFITHLTALFASVARADGAITREEVRAIRRFFDEELRVGADDLALVRKLLKAAIHKPVDVEEATGWYREHSEAGERLLFLQAVYGMACDMGTPDSRTQKVIGRIVVGLGIAEADHHGIRSMFIEVDSGTSLSSDYEVLGVPAGCEDGELKKAFRAMAARHHPDKVTHLGPDAVALAQKRFGEVKAAYDRIRAARGAV